MQNKSTPKVISAILYIFSCEPTDPPCCRLKRAGNFSKAAQMVLGGLKSIIWILLSIVLAVTLANSL